MKRGALLLSPFGLAQLVTILAVAIALWIAYDPWRWGRLKDEIHARFPMVPRITSEELNGWLHRPELQPVILDARSENEYNASHLPGARRSTLTLAQLGLDGKFDQPVVIYCAVGYESAPVAVRFLAQGFKRVQYLDGGIYYWAHEDLPLETLRGPATKVLPGDAQFSSYLPRSRRAP
jgi:rhodanese-related sulfurtransferase